MADDQRLLEAGIQGVYRIGDCVVPRIIAEAIFDGHRLGREIDTSDPATPLPYIRERRVLTETGYDFDALLDLSASRTFRPRTMRNQPRSS